jgi:hypothetical protein
MPPELSIVQVDKRKYRTIARENWGLTKKQMKGMHVHHRIPISKGGTDDPTNLYVCSPSFHRWKWHNGEEFIEWASEGGRKGGTKVTELGVGFHAPGMASKGGKKGGINGGKKGGKRAAELGVGAHAPGMTSKGGTKTAELGVGIHAPGMQSKGGKKGGKTAISQKWKDPDHPELGEHSAPTLAQMQKRRGYPHGKENRVRVG